LILKIYDFEKFCPLVAFLTMILMHYLSLSLTHCLSFFLVSQTPPTAISEFVDQDCRSGVITGNLTVTAARNESDVNEYVLYWANVGATGAMTSIGQRHFISSNYPRLFTILPKLA
jgi:hypothetical protein